MTGFPFERMHSLYLHELVEAASKASFAVGWIQYRNSNVGADTACTSSGGTQIRMKEDEVLLKLMPL